MLVRANDLDATDLFCGAGGSSQALHELGFTVRIAANHWDRAITTHQLNFPDTDHDIADISQVDPRRYPRTLLLWASPECTNQSQSKAGNKSRKMDPLPKRGELYPPLPKEAAQRSRATMWDVVRFSEHHRYRFVVVENVIEVYEWAPFNAWLAAMHALGYQHKVIFLNSMFAHGKDFYGAPQSRDRMYVAFWRVGDPEPDLDIRPPAHCDRCDVEVEAIQTWKRPDRQWGRYRQQYTYTCPLCSTIVEPYALPALSALDWTLEGQRIGDRKRPLADGTIRRIEAGLERWGGDYGYVPLLIPMDHNKKPDSKRARPVHAVLPTQTARATLGLAVPFMPFIASIRGGGCRKKVNPITTPLMTISAGGNHHLLVTPPGFVMRNNNSSSPSSTGAEMCTPFWEPIRTLTTKGHQSIVLASELRPTLEDVTFRMVEPHEVKNGMAFTSAYIVTGNKREQVRQLGNAVTPPAPQLIVSRMVAALEGEVAA